MGVTAARRQAGRARARIAEVDRQVRRAADNDPARVGRDHRIGTAKRDARRALRRRHRAERQRRAADAEAGMALHRLLAEGLTTADTAVLVGLSRSQVKRLLRAAVACTGLPERRLSTSSQREEAVAGRGVQREPGGSSSGRGLEGMP